MAKIRGIRPDFWTDEDIVELTPLARLLYIGLWNYACDNGHLEDRPKQLKMRILPADDCSVAELLRELAENGRITRREGWITVPNLGHHQRIDKRFFTTCDMPTCSHPDPKKADPKRKTRRAPDVDTSRPRMDHASAPGDGDGDGDVDSDVDSEGDWALASEPDESPRQLALVESINAGTLVGEWIEHCEQRPPGKVIGHVSRELKTMLDEGVDPIRLRFALAEWNRRGLHPSTLPSLVHELANRRATPKRGDIDWDAAFARASAKTEGAQP